MINPIRNQKGIALVVTLMMLVLGFAVVATLLRLSTQETKLARLEQGYTTSLDAAKAGTDLFIEQVQQWEANLPKPLPASPPFNGSYLLNGTCLTIKMSQQTSSWTSTTGWNTGCPTLANAISPFPTDSTNTANYYSDATLPLGNYTVYLKVIDNYQSNPNGTPPPCQNGCYYYTVLARAQAQGSNEHADIQFVYRLDE